jgi:hypothetical protein
VDQALHVDPLGGEQGEAGGEIEAHLAPEHRAGAHTGAVGFVDHGRRGPGNDVAQQVQVGASVMGG